MKTYALVGHFNKDLEEKLLDLWRDLRDLGLSNYGYIYEGRLPHITLTDLQAGSDDELISLIRDFSMTPVPIQINSVSSFLGSKTLVYSIHPSSDLLALHDLVTQCLDPYIARDSQYRPDSWLPHTTIASRLMDKEILEAFDLARQGKGISGILEKLVLLHVKSQEEVKVILEVNLT